MAWDREKWMAFVNTVIFMQEISRLSESVIGFEEGLLCLEVYINFTCPSI